jgi:nucleotide-binding universal stress UspA family protein
MPNLGDTTAIPPERILVATDFSPASATARDYALELAAPVAEVTFLHSTVMPVPEAAPQPGWMPDEPSPRAALLEGLRAFAEPARLRGCVVRLLLEEGLPSEAILAATRATRADLVALGTHGRRGCERWIQGSTAQRVLRHCPVPVLTASSVGSGRAARVQRILCAVGTTDSATTLAFAHRLAESSRARLTVVHVVEPPAHLTLSLTEGLDSYTISAELRARARIGAALHSCGADAGALVIAAGNAKCEILRVAAIASADLIVMGARDAHPAEAGFFGSTVEHIGRDAFCPVLTLRHPVAPPSATRKTQEELATAG